MIINIINIILIIMIMIMSMVMACKQIYERSVR